MKKNLLSEIFRKETKDKNIIAEPIVFDKSWNNTLKITKKAIQEMEK